MDLHIKNRTAVVTGGDSGIGLATAKLLAAEGVRIVLTDKTNDALANAGNEVRGHSANAQSVITVTADLRDNEQVLNLAKKCIDTFGDTGILVHCAGTSGPSGDFLSIDDNGWLETIDVDLMSAVRVCRAFIPQMLKKKWGRIVLISSENGLQPYPNESPYNACKAAIINLAKCLSKAYSPQGVMINCVSPAFIATPMTDAMMKKKAKENNISKEEAVQEFLKSDRPHIVAGRRGKPVEVAAVIALLCSEYANYITGSNYRVDGGSVSSAFG